MKFVFFGRSFDFLTNDAQYEKLQGFLKMFLLKPAALAAIVLLLLYVCLAVFFRITEKRERLRAMLDLAPYIYYLIILFLAVISRDGGVRVVRWTFDSWFAGSSAFHESNVLSFLLDIIVFMPLGILLKWRMQKRKNSVVCVVGLAFLIEILQFIFARGIASVSNFTAFAAGGVLGVLLAGLRHS